MKVFYAKVAHIDDLIPCDVVSIRRSGLVSLNIWQVSKTSGMPDPITLR